MTRSRLALTTASALTAAAVLAGCASSVDGTATSSSPAGFPSSSAPAPNTSSSAPAPTSSSASSQSAPANGSFPTTTATLADFLEAGTSTITSAHATFDFDLGGTKITSTGDENISAGKATTFAIVENLPGTGQLELRNVDGVLYVQDPTRSQAKPWVKVTAATKDPELAQIYSSLQNSSSLGSLDGIGMFLKATSAVKYLGTGTVDGTTVGKYSFVVDVTKLPADYPNRAVIEASGVKTIPVQIQVDQQGRARSGSDVVKVGAMSLTVTFTLSDFNKPVHVEAPPASQTTTS